MISLHGRGDSFGRCLLLWTICVLLFTPELSAQEAKEGLSPFEVRMVWEVNRHSLEGTLGYSFLRESEGTMRAELGVLTVPFAGVSGTYFLYTGEHVKVGPELGLLLTPVASCPPFCPSAGL